MYDIRNWKRYPRLTVVGSAGLRLLSLGDARTSYTNCLSVTNHRQRGTHRVGPLRVAGSKPRINSAFRLKMCGAGEAVVDVRTSLTLEANAFENDSALSQSTVADDFSRHNTELKFVQSLTSLPGQSAILASGCSTGLFHGKRPKSRCLRRTTATYARRSAAERVRRY